MRMFLRKSSVGRDPLVMAMSGVRMGERLLQIGVDDPAVLGALAAKVGLSGHAAVVVVDERSAARARAGIADAATLADVSVSVDGALPCASDSFDVVIIHSNHGVLAGLTGAVRSRLLLEVVRSMRSGGRAIAVEPGGRSGLKAMLATAPKRHEQYENGGGTIGALEAAGLRPVRMLAERDGYRFIEGLKAG